MNSVLSALFFGALLATGATMEASAQIRVAPPGYPRLQAMPGLADQGIKADKPAGGDAGSAPADKTVVLGITLDDLLAMAKQAGVADAQIIESSDKRTKLVAGTSQDVVVNFYAFECDKALCQAVGWYAFFGKQDEVDGRFAASFNGKYFTKLSKYEDGDVVLFYTVKTYGGVTRLHLQNMTTIFVQSIKTAIDFQPS